MYNRRCEPRAGEERPEPWFSTFQNLWALQPHYGRYVVAARHCLQAHIQ